MTKKPKKSGRAPVKDASMAQLEQDLTRTKRALGNKKLLPSSKVFYSRRQGMVEAEIERRRS